MNKYEQISFYPTDIYLPQKADMEKWSVVACDQYTSQPEYWNEVEKLTKGAVSSYNLILPEIFLNDGNVEERITSINQNMSEYLSSVLRVHKNCFVYVERTLRSGVVRKGIVGAVDLEQYEFAPGNNAAIRATEGTVAKRIPPRMRVRENAVLELPHVMLLIDDKNDIVFGNIKDNICEKLYDFDLMMDSGHIKGYLIKDNDTLADSFLSLKSHTEAENGTMLFAVGDGNHSLATAKACWEELKKKGAPADHPARYALAEVVNLHDDGLLFEPIHRIVFNCDADKLLNSFKEYCGATEENTEEGRELSVVLNCKVTKLYINKPSSKLTVGTLQNFLDKFLAENEGDIDYIHGGEVVKQLSKQENSIGFLLPKPNKSDLFAAIINDGILPRKTFSMGEAYDKRFYTEARKISLEK